MLCHAELDSASLETLNCKIGGANQVQGSDINAVIYPENNRTPKYQPQHLKK